MVERVGQPPFTEWTSSSDVVLQAKIVGEAYPRFTLTADGVVATGAGSGAPAAKPSLGTSAAATTPGTVVKKIQVFDAAGASLGYIPIYDAVT